MEMDIFEEQLAETVRMCGKLEDFQEFCRSLDRPLHVQFWQGASTAWTRASATPSMTSRHKNHGDRSSSQGSRPPTGYLIPTQSGQKQPSLQHN